MNAVANDCPSVYSFGRWRFDARTGDLSDGTTTGRLEPQVAKVLDYFLRNQGVLISRDELMAAVWDDRIVSDDASNRCISILRNQLSPDDRNAYIETVVRRGFISHFPPPEDHPADEPVDDTADEAADDTIYETAPAAQSLHRSKAWVPVALAGFAVLIIVGALRMFGDSPLPAGVAESTGVPLVAVLPFISDGLEGDSDFIARGIHDDLLTQLAQMQSLRVVSRTSVADYRASEGSIRDIGRQLGADAVLEGGVQRVGDQIRINVQLVDAGTDVHLWAHQYDRELTPANIFDIQAEIARSIASALGSELTAQDDLNLALLPTENMAAYRAYHEAMKLRDTETIAAPAYVAAMERAVALDPGFVRAWAELAGSLSYMNIQERDPESIERLESILERIRALAPGSSEYLIAQSYFTYYILKDYDRAFELIGRAQHLRPSDPQVLELQSWIQRRRGDVDGVIESIRQARTLDPLSAYWTERLVFSLMFAHRYDEASRVLANASPDSFKLAFLRSNVRVREHRDLSRLSDDLIAAQKEYGVTAEPSDLWEAYIAGRDFDAAAALLTGVQTTGSPADDWTAYAGLSFDAARAITDWFLGAEPQAAPALTEAREEPDQDGQPGVGRFAANSYLDSALIAAARGSTAEAERLVRTWFRDAAQDLAELANMRHYACRALGMAAAVFAALDCLRSGLASTSRVHPFIEPFLPYYDSMREDPRFVELLAELEGA